jgi:hypothetical protein
VTQHPPFVRDSPVGVEGIGHVAVRAVHWRPDGAIKRGPVEGWRQLCRGVAARIAKVRFY